MANKLTEGLHVNYALSAYSLKRGDIRNAIVLKVQANGDANLVVTLADNDFNVETLNEGRIEYAIIEHGKAVKVSHGKVIDGYLYVNNVAQGNEPSTWDFK